MLQTGPDTDLRMLNVPTYCGISLLVITGNTIQTVCSTMFC